MAIYGWLRELEEILKANGKLPPEIFMQIDGEYVSFLSFLPVYVI